MIHYAKKKVERSIVMHINCDRCGKKMTPTGIDNGWWPGGSLHPQFGYGSKHDGSCTPIDLCDDCYTRFIQDFLGEVPF